MSLLSDQSYFLCGGMLLCITVLLVGWSRVEVSSTVEGGFKGRGRVGRDRQRQPAPLSLVVLLLSRRPTTLAPACAQSNLEPCSLV